jgi:hypothetical protein
MSYPSPRDINSSAPNWITVAKGNDGTGFAIRNGLGMTKLARSGPYLARQLSVFRNRGVLAPASEFVLRAPAPDG